MATLLYSGDSNTDTQHILSYIDEFTKNINVSDIQIEMNLLERVVKIMHQEFPCTGGLEKASVFKKVANFAAYFIAERPIQNAFPEEAVGSELFTINNHQNAIIAFSICIKALHGAKIVRDDGSEICLENPIKLSKHSYIDIIEAISVVSPATHFKLLAVFFEQLSYKANPDAQYNIMVV